MHSSDGWRTLWSQRAARRRSDLCDIALIRDEPTAVMRQLLQRLLEGPKPDGLALELIASKRQSACLVEGASEAVILFDLAQSMVLKELFRLVRIDRPYDDIAYLVAGCAGLSVADESPKLCAALLSMPERSEEPQYIYDMSTMLEYYAQFRGILPQLLFQWQAPLIDGYILAHEVSHFLLNRPDFIMARMKHEARNAFNFALQQVCYEREPNFDEIAQRGGLLRIDPAQLERLRLDLSNRREYYEAHANEIIEEIACDAHGLLTTASTLHSVWAGGATHPDDIIAAYLQFARTYFLLFALGDFHQAMIQRAKLSVRAGVLTEKPGDIATMHLRKIALIHGMADQVGTFLPEAMRTQAHFERFLQAFAEAIGAFKQMIDALIVSPATLVVRDVILRCERDDTPAAEAPAAPPVWQSHLGRLFGHDRWHRTFRELER
jgi:hypothetical protein